MSKSKNEPLIEEITRRIILAFKSNGGFVESFGIPATEWPEFLLAYERHFGACYAAPFDRPNLILMGIPVYPLTPVIH